MTLTDRRRQLRSPDVRVRLRATRELATLGPEAEPLLQRALVDTSPQVRAAALEVVDETRLFDTQETLLTLLDIGYGDVRDHAARKLGEMGDERALIPLMAAYQRCFAGVAPRKMRIIGNYLLFAYGLVILWTLWTLATGKVAVQDLLMPGLILFSTRPGARCRGDSWRVVLEAIMKLAERSPRPELQRLLPDLQSLAVDREVHPEAQGVARSAAQRIQALTAAIQDLPVPTTAHPLVESALPVPSGSLAESTVGQSAASESRNR